MFKITGAHVTGDDKIQGRATGSDFNRRLVIFAKTVVGTSLGYSGPCADRR